MKAPADLRAASKRLRESPLEGYPGRAGRPRKHPEDGHDGGHVARAASQPRAVRRENGAESGAGVRATPVVALERPAEAVVQVAPRLLSLRDTARYLGLSRRTVEGYVAAGLLVPTRLPSPRGGRRLGRVLLDRQDVDRFIAGAVGRAGEPAGGRP